MENELFLSKEMSNNIHLHFRFSSGSEEIVGFRGRCLPAVAWGGVEEGRTVHCQYHFPKGSFTTEVLRKFTYIVEEVNKLTTYFGCFILDYYILYYIPKK